MPPCKKIYTIILSHTFPFVNTKLQAGASLTAPTLSLVNSLTLVEHRILPSLNLVCNGTKFYSNTSKNFRFTVLSENYVPRKTKLSDNKSTVSVKVSERKQASS